MRSASDTKYSYLLACTCLLFLFVFCLFVSLVFLLCLAFEGPNAPRGVKNDVLTKDSRRAVESSNGLPHLLACRLGHSSDLFSCVIFNKIISEQLVPKMSSLPPFGTAVIKLGTLNEHYFLFGSLYQVMFIYIF